jgi:hypothetical protein
MPESTAGSLQFLLGSFTGEEQMHASAWAPAGPATSRSAATAEVDDTLVVQRYLQHRQGHPPFAIHAVWTTDAATGEILYWGFDSAGFAPDPPARGTWLGGELVLDRTTPRGSSRLVVAPTADGWSWSKAFHAPGETEWTPVQQAMFRPAPATSEK